MATIRDLRDRIDSVGSIQKITRAMEMVATTKLRRFQTKTVAAKPYGDRLDALVAGLSGTLSGDSSAAGSAAALFAPGNTEAPVGILLVGSDRGLCGAYNSNIQRKLDAELAKIEGDYVLYVVGKKAMAYAARMNYPVGHYFEDFNLEKMGSILKKVVDNRYLHLTMKEDKEQYGFTPYFQLLQEDGVEANHLAILRSGKERYRNIGLLSIHFIKRKKKSLTEKEQMLLAKARRDIQMLLVGDVKGYPKNHI